MKSKQTPRLLMIGLTLTWAIWAIWPTIQYQGLSNAEKETLREEGKLDPIESRTIKQGLDLKGGMYIVLEVDLPTLLENIAENKDSKFSRSIASVRERLSQTPEADFFTLFTNLTNQNKLKLSRYYYDHGSSNSDILSSLGEESEDAINRVLEILVNRVDQFGVAEPTIQKQGSQRIIVELAGIQDSERARALLESTALLEFFIVKDISTTNQLMVRIDQVLKGDESIAAITKVKAAEEKIKSQKSDDETVSVSELFGESENSDTQSDSAAVDENIFAERPFSAMLRNLGQTIGVPEKNIYAVKKILERPEVQEKLAAVGGMFLFSHKAEEYPLVDGTLETMYSLFLVEDEAELTGGVVEEAKANLGPQGSTSAGQPIVNLSMNSDGARKWSIVTGSNVGRQVALVLDKKVHMAPNIKEKISGGGTLIEGFADINEAKDIAIVLRAGALPAPVDIIEERVIGPSLGADSVRSGTLSVIIGLGLVLIFMLIYYRFSGLIADFALIWNIVLVLAVLASLQATLTLPGIAGLILTVGMSIDANVIIFERIREELRKGKTPKAAVKSGYDRALTTIIDANVTTVIAALVLWQFGTGPIKGFATVLFWGILVSMFTAIFVTRTIFNSFTSRKGFTKLSI
ncbi:MAG: protein translocase subunit SecD [Candidatus Marinimicrobia bacterium]|jgi:preprotein translocase subunit SecD|nr:protein translocase subunit SecD [Candidatus Neomarinimicrobiota bacterium]MBT3946541.1 protein translocase subunit SecD [Candidatus Neomarinimicrobiota bacterium]MBT4064033.1 protein translocase subunit SecD [Candidatus Neomarinimicrobiota bacterium]MBT4454047.1 protein translocase subunit SecD [Candidatus Neomarinimicrobiota bacterium]MBT6390743.1 protein translocase subunit SecD [Candidatus Neomarinimicrobiota bacterium]